LDGNERYGGRALQDAPRDRRPFFAHKLRQFRWELRTIAGQYPAASRALVRRSGVRVGADTDIVIDGFARAGNTFAVTAFLQAQPAPWELRVAHHVHTPAQLIMGARRGIPTIALIRDPEDAVLSLVIRLPQLTLRQAIRSYIRFYRPLSPYRGRLVVADFGEVVQDFGAVIRRVNERFGTDFTEYKHTPSSVRRSMEAIDESDRSSFGGGEILERSRARPTPSKEGLKDELRPRYRSASLTRVRGLATDLYRSLTDG
jgi:hypothetical protein